MSMKMVERVHCAKSVANSNFFDMGQHFPTFHHCLGTGEPASQFCHRLTESNLACLPSSRLKNGPKVGDGILYPKRLNLDLLCPSLLTAKSLLALTASDCR